MNRKTFWISFAIGFFATMCAVYLGFKSMTSAPEINVAAIPLTNLQGQPVNLTDLQTKPMVVNYWATWCKPCIEEFPHFEKVKQEYGSRVHFLMVTDESAEKVSRFTQNNPYSFTFLQADKMLGEYGLNARPATYLYDATGQVLRKEVGQLSEQQLRKWLESALEE